MDELRNALARESEGIGVRCGSSRPTQCATDSLGRA